MSSVSLYIYIQNTYAAIFPRSRIHSTKSPIISPTRYYSHFRKQKNYRALVPVASHKIVALIIRTGFWGLLFYNYNKELVIVDAPNIEPYYRYLIDPFKDPFKKNTKIIYPTVP